MGTCASRRTFVNASHLGGRVDGQSSKSGAGVPIARQDLPVPLPGAWSAPPRSLSEQSEIDPSRLRLGDFVRNTRQ